jgi:GNAT superfamily N-acetyltransferase
MIARRNRQGCPTMSPSLPLRFRSSAGGWTPEFEHAFRAFYADVYEPAFPDPDIRDSAANLKRAADPDLASEDQPRGFIDLAMAARDGREVVAGGIVYELFSSAGAALVSYVVAAEGWRGKGIARSLLNHARQTLKAEGGGDEALLIFAETEPDTGTEEDRIRLRALGRLGFAVLDCDYVQPPLGPGKHHVPLTLLLHRPQADSVPAARVEGFLRTFYRSMVGDALPEDAILQQVLAPLTARQTIAVRPLQRE